MKKLALLTPVFALALMLFAPAVEQADARERTNTRTRDRVCQFLERREIRSWNRFDQDRNSRVRSVQFWVNIQDRFGCQANGTIVEQLLERKQFSTLATALTEANLVDTLNSEGDFTVFAPTNQAFDKLGDETLNVVLADIDQLTNILTYHVVDPAAVPNAVPSDVAVTLDAAPMFNGDDVAIEVRGGKLFINDSQVVVTDLKTTNGIVHVIDTVLLP